MSLKITEKLKSYLIREHGLEPDGSDQYYEHQISELIADGELQAKELVKLTGARMKTKNVDPDKVFNRKSESSFHVKSPSEQFQETKSVGKHIKTGLPVRNEFGREVLLPSQSEHAKFGCLMKHLARKAGVLTNPASEFERTMLDEIAQDDPWCGRLGNEWYTDIRDSESLSVKALLDDNTSGGLEVAPIFVDENLVTYPLLSGELAPYVDLQPISRGRRIEGAAISNVAIQSGGVDDTDIPLATTTSLISALDSTVFVANLSILCGRDWLSDSVETVGSILEQLMGSALQKWLDEQICLGDGTTEPEGIFSASGIGSVTSDNAGTGPVTIGDMLDLVFGVDKQYRRPELNPVFICNDTSYLRSRASLLVNNSSDARFLLDPQMSNFGGNVVNSYNSLGYPVRIQNDIPNTKIAFGCLKKYRLYRRMGVEIRWEQGGQTLARKNEALLICRARFAGRVMDPNAFAATTNAQS